MTLPTNPAEQLTHGLNNPMSGWSDRVLTNLLAETLAIMAKHGRSPRDVSHVAWDAERRDGIQPGWCRWGHFEPVAGRIDYYAGYGSEFVAQSLVVVGIDGWWLERWGYDGSEGWHYRAAPTTPTGAGRTPALDDLLMSYRGSGSTGVAIRDEPPLAEEIPDSKTLEGVAVRDDPEAGLPDAGPPMTFAEKTAATVANAAEQLAREGLGKVYVPPEDVPGIMGYFKDVLSRATGVNLDPPVEAVVIQGEAEVRREDGGQALIYSVYPGSLNESLFVRVQSWDAAGEHRVLKALGTKLKVTVEPLPKE